MSFWSILLDHVATIVLVITAGALMAVLSVVVEDLVNTYGTRKHKFRLLKKAHQVTDALYEKKMRSPHK